MYQNQVITVFQYLIKFFIYLNIYDERILIRYVNDMIINISYRW